MTDLDTPTPLTDWLSGTLTLVFAHGATVTRHMPLSTATEVRQVAAGSRDGDGLRWCDTGWLQFARDELVFIDFALDETGGWRLSAEDRRILDRTPYRRGVLVALRDFWETQTEREACYSARALVTLHHRALANEAEEEWHILARALEGEAGARRVVAAHESLKQEQVDEAAPDSLDLTFDLGPGVADDLDDHLPRRSPKADEAEEPATGATSDEPEAASSDQGEDDGDGA
ncbi:hypothetical protein P5P86_19580 [Nocardioides sp. BP30]|uniref:hypothetical protein n=1 Tax=Nocardioides sp. BP30 TaxID=3036374 RepID=UPI0024693C19|nr:hypothetical protein [Nocardioides sp. BP30]WGL52140.1 hypothetical protein P5P86_19580 [Nocardioides sp. BP30]